MKKLFLALLMVFTFAFANAQVTYTKVRLTTPTPTVVRTIDFNNDTLSDIVCVSGLGNTVTSYADDGGRTFDTVNAYSLSANAIDFTIAHPTTSAKSLSVFYPAGRRYIGQLQVSVLPNVATTPTFLTTEVANIKIGTFSSPKQVVVTDMNGDGFKDYVVATASGNVTVKTCNVGGTVTASTDVATGFQAPVNGVACANFTINSRVDIVSVTDNGIAVDTQNTSGVFVPYKKIALGKRYGSIAYGTLDAGATLDIVVTDNVNNVIDVYTGNGQGIFTFSASYATGKNPVSVCVGDFDYDGKVDIAVACYGTNKIEIFYKN